MSASPAEQRPKLGAALTRLLPTKARPRANSAPCAPPPPPPLPPPPGPSSTGLSTAASPSASTGSAPTASPTSSARLKRHAVSAPSSSSSSTTASHPVHCVPAPSRPRPHRHARRFAPRDPELRAARAAAALAAYPGPPPSAALASLSARQRFRPRPPLDHGLLEPFKRARGGGSSSGSRGGGSAATVTTTTTTTTTTPCTPAVDAEPAVVVELDDDGVERPVRHTSHPPPAVTSPLSSSASLSTLSADGAAYGVPACADALSTQAAPATPAHSPPRSPAEPRSSPHADLLAGAYTDAGAETDPAHDVSDKRPTHTALARCDCAARTQHELALLRRLVTREVAEAAAACAARAAIAEDAAGEAVRVAVAADARVDAVRRVVADRRRGRRGPAAALAALAADWAAAAVLFVLAVVVARPCAWIRRVWRGRRGRGVAGRTGETGASGAREAPVRAGQGAIRSPDQPLAASLGLTAAGSPPQRSPLQQQQQLLQLSPARLSRGWRLSMREMEDPFLRSVARRISFSATAAAALDGE